MRQHDFAGALAEWIPTTRLPGNPFIVPTSLPHSPQTLLRLWLSYVLYPKLFKGGVIGAIKGDTRSLDYSSYDSCRGLLLGAGIADYDVKP